MKIAIMHEMLVKLGGAEKVVEYLMKMFPNADIFTLLYDEKKVENIFPKEKINKQVFSLGSQKVYKVTKNQRLSLLFMEKSVESLDFSEYNVVICSSSAFAHGIITKPETKLIVYYHSPSRYLWDWTSEYKRDIGWNKGLKAFILNRVFLKLRKWDFLASKRSDIILANSKNTASRIKKYYKKDSEILYPPIEVNRFQKKLNKPPLNSLFVKEKIGDYYIIISALTEFKRIDIAIKGFNEMQGKRLIIVGNGNIMGKLESNSNENIVFVGFKFGKELVSLVQNSSGLVFPGEEDFGIVPIEVMAAGKPVFAYKGGGLLETIIEGETGEFFEDKDGEDFVLKFKFFDENNSKGKYSKKKCKEQAEKFSGKEFEIRVRELVEN